ncbi:MAG: hypothetical protein ABR999_00115 [Methanoregula sp.]|jgi:hypothetical protein|uniref:hypothetical protein n=1 Tax=Methanoregula sp. TaxID=2052170 RepID=UPI003D0F230B
MHIGSGILCAVLATVLVSAGCLSAIFPDLVPAPTLTPTPAPVPTTESQVATVPVSQMALQPSDMPSDYILKDRSDLSYLEMDQMSHDLGWKAGYVVTYYRMNQEKYDMTEIRQVIDLYPLENMNKVFDIEKDAISSQKTTLTQIYELPCPNMGDRTFAYRTSDTQNLLSITTYSIIFTNKDVYEELTMSGTTTDFETLKELAQTATDKIQ